MAQPALFGSEARDDVLLSVSLLEETYISELAQVAGRPFASVYKIVDALEQAGVLATKLVGRNRSVRLNPRYLAATEVQALLQKLVRKRPDLQSRAEEIRRRSRRIGKPL